MVSGTKNLTKLNVNTFTGNSVKSTITKYYFPIYHSLLIFRSGIFAAACHTIMQLREFINYLLHTDFVSDDELPFPITQKHFAKGDLITDYGQVEQCAYFMNEGVVQFSIRHGDEEKIIDFFMTNDFVSSYTSFLLKKPSDVQIIALTDCRAEIIGHAEMTAAYKTSLVANQLGRIVTEGAYLTKVKREKDFLTKTAEERYGQLMREKPELILQIPINKIAKYLGIYPESLSRIRKKIIS
jgi:CRP-like cAMP-binding protein